MTALPVSWLAECGLSSYTGCSPILQGIARGHAKGTGRAHLVTESPVSVEWENSDSETNSGCDTI